MSGDRLDPADVELMARRVAELVAIKADRLVTAAELAEHLAVERSYVYRHAQRLGVVRLGEGPRAPLRFRRSDAERAMTAREAVKRSPTPQPRLRRRARNGQKAPSARLLPIRGELRGGPSGV
jgi:hypothetical protein